MRSKASEVTQAAKEMAKKVEQAFREELDIHSPSRVMMSLGKFASIGVVKGLDSVDVKKFAENQAGSLIGAFSGMGASGLSVQQWLMAALMATGTSMSWLPGLMTSLSTNQMVTRKPSTCGIPTPRRERLLKG